MACFHRTDEAAEALRRVSFFHGSYYNRNRQPYSCSLEETYAIHDYQNILNLDFGLLFHYLPARMRDCGNGRVRYHSLLF